MPAIVKSIVTRLALDGKQFSSKISATEKSILAFSGAIAGFKALDAKQDRRSQALASFSCFLESYFKHYFTIPSGPQQEELIALIENLKDRSKRQVKKYSRAVSRGFGKSTIITLCGVLWLLLRGDWKFVILISASMPHAEGFLRKISDETEGNELLLEDFPELEAGKDSNGTTIAWNDRHLVFAGGFAVLAKGFGNKIRGLRYKNYRPDAIVIDDPDEYSDVESQTTMQRRYRWLERSALKTGSVLAGLDVIIVYTTIAENGAKNHPGAKLYWLYPAYLFYLIYSSQRDFEYCLNRQ